MDDGRKQPADQVSHFIFYHYVIPRSRRGWTVSALKFCIDKRNVALHYRWSDQVTVFLPRQLQGMFTRNQAQSKYWKLQIDKNLATNGSRGSGTRPNHSLLSSLNIVPSDIRRRHMEDTDASRKQKCSRLHASRFYQQNTQLTVGKSTHSLVIQLEARSLWLCETKPDILRHMRFLWQWVWIFLFWDTIPCYFGR